MEGQDQRNHGVLGQDKQEDVVNYYIKGTRICWQVQEDDRKPLIQGYLFEARIWGIWPCEVL